MRKNVRAQIIDWIKSLDDEVISIEINYDSDQLTMTCSESHNCREKEVRE